MTKASIVVTCYNIAEYIEDCLSDIDNQTLADYEVIVVDDGSTDGTSEIVDDFCKTRENFHVIPFQHNTPGGVGTAANAGIDAAKGEYVCFADGDDRYDQDMFKRLVDAAETFETDIAVCNYFVMDTETEELSFPTDDHRWESIETNKRIPLDDSFKKELLKFIPVPWRKVYRRSFLVENNIKFPEVEHFYEDNPFHWDVVQHAKSVVFVPERLCKHRVNRAGQTMSSSPLKLLELFKNYDLIRQRLEKSSNLELFSLPLLEWLFAQSSWIAERCGEANAKAFINATHPLYKNHTPEEMRSLLRKHRFSNRSVFVAAGSFLGKESVVREAFLPLDERSVKSKVRVSFVRKGAIGAITTSLKEIVKMAASTFSIVFENVFVQDTRRTVKKIEQEVEEHSRRVSDQMDVINAALLIIEERLEKLQAQNPAADQSASLDTSAKNSAHQQKIDAGES